MATIDSPTRETAPSAIRPDWSFATMFARSVSVERSHQRSRSHASSMSQR